MWPNDAGSPASPEAEGVPALQDSKPTDVDVMTQPQQWFWHAFHEQLAVELFSTGNERISEIKEFKPDWQQARRLRLIRPANIESVKPLYEKAYGNTGGFKSVDGFYPFYRHPEIADELRRLHDEQCVKNQPLGCPWTEEVFPGYTIKVGTIFPEVMRAGGSVGSVEEGSEWDGDPLE